MAEPPKQSKTPVRTHPQRMDALRRANEIRSLRATLKREVREGTTSIVTVLEDPPEFLRTAKVMDLVLVVPKIGRVKASKLLTRCRISPSKTVGGLSDRQRSELISQLRGFNGAGS